MLWTDLGHLLRTYSWHFPFLNRWLTSCFLSNWATVGTLPMSSKAPPGLCSFAFMGRGEDADSAFEVYVWWGVVCLLLLLLFCLLVGLITLRSAPLSVLKLMSEPTTSTSLSTVVRDLELSLSHSSMFQHWRFVVQSVCCADCNRRTVHFRSRHCGRCDAEAGADDTQKWSDSVYRNCGWTCL